MNLNEEDLKEIIEISLYLEYLGIHEEKTGQTEKGLIYFFSVPEKSTIEAKNDEDKDKIQTSDGLIKLAKDTLIELFIKMLFTEFDEDDPFHKKFMEELKNDPSGIVKFYAKVRKDETWTEEMGQKAMNKVIENCSYKKV